MQDFAVPEQRPNCETTFDNGAGKCPWGCDHGWSDGGGCPAGMETHNGETCEYSGCTDPADAANYDPKATFDDGSCDYPGCMDPDAYNFDQAATSDDGTCELPGCTDEFAENYDQAANVDDGSCHYWTPDTFEDATMHPAMMDAAAGGR